MSTHTHRHRHQQTLAEIFTCSFSKWEWQGKKGRREVGGITEDNPGLAVRAAISILMTEKESERGGGRRGERGIERWTQKQ